MTGHPSSYLNVLISLASRIVVGEYIVPQRFIQALPPFAKTVITSQIDVETDRFLIHFNKQQAAQPSK